ncbi:MAG TPA: DUF2807 domain-containing protein [Sphingomicrobium sp.]|nr:DUF2807 domain-containing protein [Sphingomicrobium sp.]
MIRTTLPLFALAFAASVPALASENIAVSPFNALELVGGGEVTVKRGPVQQVTILEGSSQYTSIRMMKDRRVRIEACNNNCPHNYRLKILVESPSVPVLAVTGGGTIITSPGFGGQHLTAAVSGGGVIDTTELPADVATAAVHGGGEIKLRAANVLTAAVKGGGTIRYWGDPQVTTAISGGGSVRPAR